MAKELTYNAELIGRDDHTAELSVFHIRYDDPLTRGGPTFVPGQYVALGLNNVKKPELGSVRRSMSLASAPEQIGHYEFYIRWVKHPESPNPLTHLLWKMRVGDRIFMTRKPVGKFTLEDTTGAEDSRKKILVAAGTGLAPFVSMARSRVLCDPKADLGDLVILHGASYPADLCYRDELGRYHEENGLHYFTTVSRPGEAADWSGATGRVEDFFKSDRLEELEESIGLGAGELGPETAGVLVCGLQGTIAQSIIRLARRGFVPDNRRIRKALEIELPPSIWWEQYDSTPVIDINDAPLVESIKVDLAAARS
jgi:ferredoxin--NADP+ reductase